MALTFTPYCVDEDVAVRACGDFQLLCPKWQVLASGTDGVFQAGAPWRLSSASVDFQARGLARGSIVVLKGPRPSFTGDGELFAVESVSSFIVDLRRVGLAVGVGQPPAPAAGLTGVVFEAPTLTPQIESACLDCNQQFGLDPNDPARAPGQVYDPNLELTQAAVLTVLQRQYAMEVRSERGDFALKLRQVESDLADLRARMRVKRGALGEADLASGLFSMRFRR